MLVNLGSKILNQLLLSHHALNQSLEPGGRNGGFGESVNESDRSDRNRSRHEG